jgi:cytochrome c oxidase subunit 2
MSARRGVGFDVKSPPKRAVRDMKAQFQGIRRMLTGASALAATMVFAGQALAEDLLGQPTPGAIDLQPAASVLKHDAIWFHNVILMPIITIITLFVAGLLAWIAIRYNKKANPIPAKFSHNTTIEIIWTVVPVIILDGDRDLLVPAAVRL